MANRNDKQVRSLMKNRLISKNLDIIKNAMNSLGRDTYFSDEDNTLDLIKQDMDVTFTKLMTDSSSSNLDFNKISTILGGRNKNNDLASLEDQLNSNNANIQSLLDLQMANKYLRDYDNEIDTVMKYFPLLADALDTKLENVLRSDKFGTDFLNLVEKVSGDIDKRTMISSNFNNMKKKYNLLNKIEEWTDEAQKYGEVYVNIVPYNKAISRYLKEEGSLETKNIQESYIKIDENKNESTHNAELKITFSNNLISSIGKQAKIDNFFRNKENRLQSFSESFISNDESFVTKEDILEVNEAVDGLIDVNNSETRKKIESSIKAKGSIVTKLNKENLLVLNIEDTCLGYIYLEGPMFNSGYNSTTTNTIIPNQFTSVTQNAVNINNTNNSIDNFLKTISANLSDTIDSKFINQNLDIKDELYTILKHTSLATGDMEESQNVRITYISPEDMHVLKFNVDPKTKRGRSDLHKGLVDAKIYACMKIVHFIATLTRGMDKRLYYVKQSVEKNINKTLQNTIYQLQKGNFGARQIDNLDYILGIAGQFNDVMIPLSPGGEAPIQFEVMEGQKIELPADFMDRLEDQAVNSTNVPIDIVKNRNSMDYAIQGTMSNIKFRNHCRARIMNDVEPFAQSVCNAIYKYEYSEDVNLEIEIPKPTFVDVTNSSNIISTHTQYAELLTNTQAATESDEVKAEFNRLIIRNALATNIDIYTNDKLLDEARLNVASRVKKEE